MKSRTGSSNGPGGSGISPSTAIHQGGTVNNSNSPATMERHGGGGSSSSSGRLRLHHKRRPGHRRNTQHNVATVEPICDLRKVINGIVTVDQDKLKKLVQKDPIDLHYAVEEEPFASGLFATVRKCRHRLTGVEYAAKYAAKLRYGQDCTAEILHEIALMSLCTTHPHIIHLIDVFDTPTHMILVMEYAPGGDLQTLMDDDMVPYERDAVKFVRQVLEGLLFLHERNMAHLDIKLQNVLLMGTFPDCDVKLCDLEISRVIVAGQEVRELLGTPDYVSPEILHYEPITLSADIWSVGVMAYVLLTGFTPFGGDTDQETFHNICHGQLDFPDELFEDISPQAEDFIRKTLSRDPSCRPTVRESLKHPWLTAWKNVVSHQRETISSESQRKNSGIPNGAFGGSGAGSTCPRSSAAATSSINGLNSSSSPSAAAAARSLQRAMSKSREVLYERVAASNLRKSTSKSRERLCEMKLSVSRSRDHLCDLLQPSAAQSRERLHSLRNLSKSHEVLSLLSDPASGHTGPIHQSNLFQLHLTNPMTNSMSLECFTIPPLQDPKQMTGSTDVASLPTLVPSSSGPIIAEAIPSTTEYEDRLRPLSSALTESTETLCDEEQETSTPTNQPESTEEITPSNSRSATPTQQVENLERRGSNATVETPSTLADSSQNKSEIIKVVPLLEEAEPTPMHRSDIVASCLKRLSRVGPPPVQASSFAESGSPANAKSPWNWPLNVASAASSMTTNTPSSPFSNSPTSSTGSGSVRKSLLLSPAPTNPKDSKLFPTSPSPQLTSKSTLDSIDSKSDVALNKSIQVSNPNSLPAPAVRLVETLPKTIATSSSSPVDTSSLTETQRQLLPSILNRRRASWAYGSKQEDIPGAPVHAVLAGKKTEPKLTVSELISNFNQSKKLGATASSSSTVSSVGSSLPTTVKKSSAASLFQQESLPLSSTQSSPSSSKILADREKAVFKPLASSMQVFQNKAPAASAASSTASLTGAQQRNPDLPTRARPHHFAWDVRALPRLPEDTVSSPRQEEATEFSAVKTQQQTAENLKTNEESKEKPVAPEVAAGFGLRSGSVSSDTGCSSSSDLSDRSSDECPDKEAQRDGGRSEQNQEINVVEETGPSASWQGRPRSFSVQSDISFLAQPWNRVCTGSVARAFEKFGTKVDGDVTVASSTATTSNLPHRSRRQSTPGPLK